MSVVVRVVLRLTCARAGSDLFIFFLSGVGVFRR